jgi:hypothetical protein
VREYRVWRVARSCPCSAVQLASVAAAQLALHSRPPMQSCKLQTIAVLLLLVCRCLGAPVGGAFSRPRSAPQWDAKHPGRNPGPLPRAMLNSERVEHEKQQSRHRQRNFSERRRDGEIVLLDSDAQASKSSPHSGKMKQQDGPGADKQQQLPEAREGDPEEGTEQLVQQLLQLVEAEHAGAEGKLVANAPLQKKQIASGAPRLPGGMKQQDGPGSDKQQQLPEAREEESDAVRQLGLQAVYAARKSALVERRILWRSRSLTLADLLAEEEVNMLNRSRPGCDTVVTKIESIRSRISGEVVRRTNDEHVSQLVTEKSTVSLEVVDLFIAVSEETLAIINSNHEMGLWTRKEPHSWSLVQTNSGQKYIGRVLPYEAHGATAVVSFGNMMQEGTQVEVYNGLESYGVRTLHRGILHGHQFFLTAAIWVRRELDQKHSLERWVQWHLGIGVEHVLIYINSPKAFDPAYMESLYKRFPSKVTFVPWYFGIWVYGGDQQAQTTHSLWTLKGVSKWMLSIDIDEFVLCKDSVQMMLQTTPQETHAFQIGSYQVMLNGKMQIEPMYGSPFKGKVILNTETVTGHSGHMVTDAIGGSKQFDDMIPGNHLPVPPDHCRLAHFRKSMEATKFLNDLYDRLYGSE